MKKILLILFVLITANAQAQYLKRYGGTGWTNTLHGEWFYNAHPSFGASDSLKIVDYAELWRAINVGGGGSAAIGSVVTGATQGSILYAGTGGILQQSNSSLFYDSTNNRVGIGTNTPSSRLDLTTTAIGVTQNNAYGISLVNPDAAAAGAQQMSPGLRLRGNGWKTNATAASQTVDWLIDVLPVQGAASPTSTLQFKSSINGAAYTLPVSFSSAGGVSATSASITSNVVAGGILAISTGNLGFSGSSRFNAPSDGNLLMIGQSGSGFNMLSFGGTTASFFGIKRSGTTGQVRLANDSDWGGWETGTLTTHSTVTMNNNPAGAATDLILVKRTDSTVGTIAASTFALADLSNTTGVLGVANGGTGNSSFTAYGLIAAGTTSTGPLQQVSGTGTSEQILVSSGAGAIPSWQTSRIKGQTTWDPASIGANSSTSTTFAVTGAELGDPVVISKTSGSYSNGELYFAFVSSADNVTIRLQNTSGGTFDIAEATYNVIVLKYTIFP